MNCLNCGTELSGRPFCGVCGTAAPTGGHDGAAHATGQQPAQFPQYLPPQQPQYPQPQYQQPQYQQPGPQQPAYQAEQHPHQGAQPYQTQLYQSPLPGPQTASGHQPQYAEYGGYGGQAGYQPTDSSYGSLPQMALIGGPQYSSNPPVKSKKWLVIGIVAAVVVAGAGVGAWLIFTGDDEVVASETVEYPQAPTLGPSIDLTELFEDASEDTIADGTYQVMAVNDDMIVLEGEASADENGLEQAEVFVAGINRETGATVWKVDSKDLAPDDLTDTGAFDCATVEPGTSIVCGATGYSESDESVLTVINASDGTFSSTEVDATFSYSFALVGGSILMSRDDNDGDAEITLINPATGDEIWAVDTPSESYGVPYVWINGDYVYSSAVDGDNYATRTSTLHDAATGEEIATFDGWLSGNNDGKTPEVWMTPVEYNEDTYYWEGIQRVDLTGNVLWSNDDLTVAGSGGATDPVLAGEEAEDNGDQVLVALNPADGKQLWSFDDGFDGYVWDYQGGAILYSGYEEDQNLMLSAATGDKLASPRGRIVGGGGALAYYADGSTLTAYSTESGSKGWQVDLEELDRSLDEDSAHVLGGRGYLFAYDEDEFRMLLPTS